MTQRNKHMSLRIGGGGRGESALGWLHSYTRHNEMGALIITSTTHICLTVICKTSIYKLAGFTAFPSSSHTSALKMRKMHREQLHAQKNTVNVYMMCVGQCTIHWYSVKQVFQFKTDATLGVCKGVCVHCSVHQ